MKFNKIFLIAAVALAGIFTSCSDDDDYSVGKQAGSYNVTFAEQSNVTVGPNDSSFDVTLKRTSTSGSLTVPIEKIQVPEGFVVPESATFADGDSLTTISIAVPSDMAYFTDYTFCIAVAEEYTNPYLAQDTYGRYQVTTVKEDYVTYATATFEDTFWYEDSWDVTIEYSAIADLYRIKGLWADGYDFYFKWNGKDDADQVFYFTDKNGTKATKFTTGLVSSSYGDISCTNMGTTNNPSDETETFAGCYEGVFYIPFKFTVSAGSFGTYNVYLKDLHLAN